MIGSSATKTLLMEFEGIRIMERSVNRNNAYIRQKLDKIKPFFCSINGINYKLLLQESRSLKRQ